MGTRLPLQLFTNHLELRTRHLRYQAETGGSGGCAGAGFNESRTASVMNGKDGAHAMG